MAAVTGSSTVLGRRPGSRGLRGVCGTQAAPPRDSGGAWGSPRVRPASAPCCAPPSFGVTLQALESAREL